ncbi:hypothetical protein DMUE_2118 [Dictyocoela muelleri]|nr:hypothetical protein DMUE_2118 [Dictyocoela muelleri]
MLSSFKLRNKKNLGKSKIRNLAKQTCLNNSEIISEVFKNLDSSEIARFPKRMSFNRMILNARDLSINSFDGVDDIPESLKLNITGKRFLQYDSGLLDKERLIIFRNSDKIPHLKNSDIWLKDDTLKKLK